MDIEDILASCNSECGDGDGGYGDGLGDGDGDGDGDGYVGDGGFGAGDGNSYFGADPGGTYEYSEAATYSYSSQGTSSYGYTLPGETPVQVTAMVGDSAANATVGSLLLETPTVIHNDLVNSGADIFVVPYVVGQSGNGTEDVFGETSEGGRSVDSVAGVYDPATNVLVVPDNSDFTSSVDPAAHEEGHFVDDYYGVLSSGSDFQTAWNTDVNNGDYNSTVNGSYYTNSAAEAFAESYAAVVSNNTDYISAHPAETTYVSNLLSSLTD